MAVNSFSPLMLRHLRFIASHFVCSSYWDDETIRYYRVFGLVARDRGRLVLTEAGKRALACETRETKEIKAETAAKEGDAADAEAAAEKPEES